MTPLANALGRKPRPSRAPGGLTAALGAGWPKPLPAPRATAGPKPMPVPKALISARGTNRALRQRHH